MTAFSRRLFLGGTIALSTFGVVKTRVEVPTLWGDLVHDDAPALNALFRGDPIRVLAGRVIEGENPVVADASMLIRSPLHIVTDTSILRCTFQASLDFPRGEAMMRFHSGSFTESGDISFNNFNLSGPL